MKGRRLAVGLGVVALLVLAAAAFWESPWLKLHDIQVVGTGHTTRAQVVGAAALVPGTRLTEISSATVERRVDRLPWVASATVTHVLPSTVRIAVTERVPAVVLQAPSGGFGDQRDYLVDATGAVLAAGSTGYPLLTGITQTALVPGGRVTASAFSAAIAVLESLPSPLRAQLAQIEAASPSAVTVALTNRTTIDYGAPSDLAAKNADVVALLGTGHSYVTIDVEAPDHPASVAR